MRMNSGASLNDHAAVFFNPDAVCCGGLSWYDPQPSIGIGYMGSISETGGNPYWSLQYNTNTNAITSAPAIQTGVPMVPGTPALMVVEETFSATGGTVNLYVNPASVAVQGPPRRAPPGQLRRQTISASRELLTMAATALARARSPICALVRPLLRSRPQRRLPSLLRQ